MLEGVRDQPAFKPLAGKVLVMKSRLKTKSETKLRGRAQERALARLRRCTTLGWKPPLS